MFTNFFIQIVISKQQKSQKVSVLSIRMKTMRHLFYITCYCGLLYSKSKEYTNQTIYDISFLLEVFVDSLILETDTAVEHYTYLVCFLSVLAVKML